MVTICPWFMCSQMQRFHGQNVLTWNIYRNVVTPPRFHPQKLLPHGIQDCRFLIYPLVIQTALGVAAEIAAKYYMKHRTYINASCLTCDLKLSNLPTVVSLRIRYFAFDLGTLQHDYTKYADKILFGIKDIKQNFNTTYSRHAWCTS